MSKKILAIALFAVMVLSLVPLASANANDFVGAGMINTSPGATSTSVYGDQWSGSISSGVVNLTLETKFSNLHKVTQDFLTDSAAKFDVLLFLDADLLANLASSDNISSVKVNNSAVGTSDMRVVDGSVAGETRLTGTTLLNHDNKIPVLGGTDVNTRIKLGTFTATKGGNSTQYVLEYFYKNGYNKIIVNVTFKDTEGASKPEKPLYVKLSNSGDPGLYNVYAIGGIIYIDYANDIDYTLGYDLSSPVIPIKFEFYEDAAGTIKVPASSQRAKVSSGSDSNRAGGKFFASTVPASGGEVRTTGATMGTRQFNGGTPSSAFTFVTPSGTIGFEGSTVLYANIPNSANGTTNQNFSIKLEGADYLYNTGDVKVVWRPVPRNQISNVVISQRNITLKVGETVTLDIVPSMQTTYSTLKLSDSSSVPYVYVDGMKVTGQRVGTTTLNVTFGNQAIDAVVVTVLAADATTPAADNQWRVIARTLNVRSGPGTGYAKVATLAMNTVVTGEDTGLGWIKLSNGTYVSKQYVVPVTTGTSTGNYVTTASSLNVRSGPGSSYGKVGSYSKGTTVTVITIQNGWAQTANGWVSTLYLQAI